MLYLLDTNIISYLLINDTTTVANFDKCLVAGNDIKIPDIAYYEVQRGLLYNNSKKLQKSFDNFCLSQGIMEVTIPAFYRAAQIYAKLRKKGQLIEDADLIIAAIAIENNAILATNNTGHMSRIEKLKLENWALA